MAASAPIAEKPPASIAAVAASYLKPRPFGAFLLGISSGFPLTLLIWTMAYWLAKVGVDKRTIGFAFALGTPYTLKFLWAPLIDGISIPVLTRLLGQRRAWLWTVQALLAVSIVAVAAIPLTAACSRRADQAQLTLVVAAVDEARQERPWEGGCSPPPLWLL